MAQKRKEAKAPRSTRTRTETAGSRCGRVKTSAQAQLQTCMAKFDASKQKSIRATRAGMRRRLPAANELLYDYGSFFVLAYSMTEHPKDAIASIAARPDGVRLYLLHGPRLPDPKKLLRGTGTQVRYVALAKPSMLSDPDVEALIAASIAASRIEMPKSGRGTLVDRTAGQKKSARSKKARPTKGSSGTDGAGSRRGVRANPRRDSKAQ